MQILDLSYFTHTTSTEKKQKIVNTVVNKYGSISYPQLSIDMTTVNITDMISNYIAGLVDGDGSVNFSFQSSRRRVVPNFTIIGDIHDYSIQNLFFSVEKFIFYQVKQHDIK